MPEYPLPIHPAADLLPLMTDTEYAELKQDIANTELRDNIVLWNDRILDGRHRIRALIELGINWKMHVDRYDEIEIPDPVAFVVSKNLQRRHLSSSQRAMVAAKAKGYYECEGKEAQREGGKKVGNGRKKVVANLPQPKKPEKKSRDKAAAAVGVSGKLVDAARKVRNDGVPELVKAVESGKVAVSAAAEVAKLPKAEQEQAVKTNTVKQKAAEVRSAKKEKKASEFNTTEATQQLFQVLKHEVNRWPEEHRHIAIHWIHQFTEKKMWL
ncbi:hypothetical protein [Fuerstiella marisgermanici]|uniref:ParB/Sulfiredoxin domain-containing protein n=1 Tax=Fuerstiella marisgermanici TaxID=1891926 RepID=A0A1P8WDQ8_9PLAN|nr:hypothetical protein [Fuerstiella marisgermanici]APZ92174.1 hypothetical protein Fuma_01782 [Fuerstiella marisgermanici]